MSEVSVKSLLAEQVLAADQAVVVDEAGRHLMPELRALSERWAAALRLAGVRPDEPVIVPVSGRAQDIAAMMAVVASGAVAVPLHRRGHSDTINHIWQLTGARLSLDCLASEPLQQRSDTPPPPPRALLNEAAFITFTSGTTGAPKGVILSSSRMLAKLHTLAELLAFPLGAAALVPLQLTFSFGQWVAFLTLMRGGTLYLTERFDAAGAQALINQQAISYLAAVPTMLRMLPELPPGEAPVVTVLAGGEAVLPDLRRRLLRQWPAAEIFGLYGLTESGTCDLILHDRPGHPVEDSLGRPSPRVEARVQAETGELQLRTPFGMLGYLDLPQETAANYDGDWLRTGDMARISDDGQVILTGRLKELINRGGNKVAPLEIEQVFAAHPEVEAALATGVNDPRLGEAVHLLIVRRPGSQSEPAQLRDWAKDHLERFKLPDQIHFAAALPIGSTGKADRAALRRQIEASAPPSGSVAP